jgi:hypothetical protein
MNRIAIAVLVVLFAIGATVSVEKAAAKKSNPAVSCCEPPPECPPQGCPSAR